MRFNSSKISGNYPSRTTGRNNVKMTLK